MANEKQKRTSRGKTTMPPGAVPGEGLYELEQEREHWLNLAVAQAITEFGLDSKPVRFSVARQRDKREWRVDRSVDGTGHFQLSLAVEDGRTAVQHALFGAIFVASNYSRRESRMVAEQLGYVYEAPAIYPVGVTPELQGRIDRVVKRLYAYPQRFKAIPRTTNRTGSPAQKLVIDANGAELTLHGGRDAVERAFHFLVEHKIRARMVQVNRGGEEGATEEAAA